MKAVIQRVKYANVKVDQKTISHIDKGLLIFLGITHDDTDKDIDWLSKKIVNLRIFNDDLDQMNCSLKDVGADAIVVSQFTLLANTKKGNRPSYINAAKPDIAIPLYRAFIKQFETYLGKNIGAGIFGADMEIEILNDGPVTILIDTKLKK